MEPKFTRNDHHIMNRLTGTNPNKWSLTQATEFKLWALKPNHDGKKCAKFLNLSYETCRQGLRNHSLLLHDATTCPIKWTQKALENIITIRRKTGKSFKEIAEDLGYKYKSMYAALRRRNMITEDLERKMKSEGFETELSLVNVPWNSKNISLTKIINKREELGSLGIHS